MKKRVADDNKEAENRQQELRSRIKELFTQDARTPSEELISRGEAILPLAEELGDLVLLGNGHHLIGWGLYRLGRYEESKREYETALKVYVDAGSALGQV